MELLTWRNLLELYAFENRFLLVLPHLRHAVYIATQIVDTSTIDLTWITNICQSYCAWNPKNGRNISVVLAKATSSKPSKYIPCHIFHNSTIKVQVKSVCTYCKSNQQFTLKISVCEKMSQANVIQLLQLYNNHMQYSIALSSTVLSWQYFVM